MRPDPAGRSALGAAGRPAIAPDLKDHGKVTAIEGDLLEVLPQVESRSLDVVLCMSVLEHLWEPGEALVHLHGVLAPRGVAVLNVPAWLGEPFLELAAFRLSLSPAEEMDDHKADHDLVTCGRCWYGPAFGRV
jgi:SAM-dependent methyltransferase